MTSKRAILLWLLVIFVGVQFGAGWYEKLAVVSLWSDVPPGQVLTAMHETGMYRAGRAFWPFVSPLVTLLAVVNLVIAWRTPSVNRRWWLAGSAVMTVTSVFTYTYFVPQLVQFQANGGEWSTERIDSFVMWWTGLNYVRMAMAGMGWLLLLRALSLSAVRTSTSSSTG